MENKEIKEINENNIKTVIEEYESKLKSKDDEINKIKTDYETRIKAINENHTKQIKGILSGRNEDFLEETKTDEDKLIERITNNIKRRI